MGGVPDQRSARVVSSRSLLPTAAQLAFTRRVYAPDLPGFGRSAQPSEDLALRELADILAAWMRAIRLERAALLGHSFGCQILAELALRQPPLLARAIFVAPTVAPHGRTAVRQVARLLRDAGREPLGLFPLGLRDYCTAGPQLSVL